MEAVVKGATILSISLTGICMTVPMALQAQRSPPSAQQLWLAMAVGGGTLGVSPVASLWYTHGPIAAGARWSETMMWFNGTGDEHELSGLVGARLPVRRGMVVGAAGVGRAAGCFVRSENAQCTSLGVEAAPVWDVDLVLPLSSHVGVHVVGFGVRGRRVQYSGMSAGLDLGRFR
jgi:hypothetical protein